MYTTGAVCEFNVEGHRPVQGAMELAVDEYSLLTEFSSEGVDDFHGQFTHCAYAQGVVAKPGFTYRAGTSEGIFLGGAQLRGVASSQPCIFGRRGICCALLGAHVYFGASGLLSVIHDKTALVHIIV
jgi:hypothetical protein